MKLEAPKGGCRVLCVAGGGDALTTMMSDCVGEYLAANNLEELRLHASISVAEAKNICSEDDAWLMFLGHGREDALMVHGKREGSVEGLYAWLGVEHVAAGNPPGIVALCCSAGAVLGADVAAKSGADRFVGFRGELWFPVGKEEWARGVLSPMFSIIANFESLRKGSADIRSQVSAAYSSAIAACRSKPDSDSCLIGMVLTRHRKAMI